MIFFSTIFTTFELGIISQQLGIKDTFWHWEWGSILAPDKADKQHRYLMIFIDNCEIIFVELS